MDILKNKPQDFLFISGDDALTYPLLALGADGVISVVANAFPQQFSDMVSLGLKGKFNKAKLMPRQIKEATYLINLALLKLHSYPYNYMEDGDEGQDHHDHDHEDHGLPAARATPPVR